MSMHDALNSLREKQIWKRMFGEQEPPPDMQPTEPESIGDAFAALLQKAAYTGEIDKQSATWFAISAWAARELLQTLDSMETADDARARELRIRARTLREVLDMDKPPKRVAKAVRQAPYIP